MWFAAARYAIVLKCSGERFIDEGGVRLTCDLG